MALTGMSNDQIALALQYRSVAGAWEAVRAAVVRHTGATSIAEVQAAMKQKESNYRTLWRAQVLLEMLELQPGGTPAATAGGTRVSHSH